MKDKIGKLPEISTPQKALEEIIKITKDKRSHVLLIDAIGWEKLKLKAIRKLAERGLSSIPKDK